MLSILHISDLHRSPGDPIDNDELVSALVADRDLYATEDPVIQAPDVIVVSGDLVQGAPLGHADPEAELKHQYDAALDFLSRITDRFASGDRRRVILVPGNHDVAWHTARAAMTPVEVDPKRELGPEIFRADGEFRWSWRERRVYRIVNRELYEQRFNGYQDLLRRFYEGTVLAYPLRHEGYFELAELLDGRIGVAAFNSCAGNDCYSHHGAIPHGAVSQAHLELHDNEAKYELLVGVWHHNMDGPPHASDYMDVATVYQLIGKGFRLGIHGHQHRAEVAHRTIQLPQRAPMAVVSAGSLCAGRKELPIGVNRQYNVIVLDDDLAGARVHVREMAVATVFGQSRRPEFLGNSFVDLRWGHEGDQPVNAGEARRTEYVIEAEVLVAHGAYGEAVEMLAPMEPAPGSYERTLLIKALTDGRLWERTLEVLGSPSTVGELVHAVGAAIELKRLDVAGRLLDENEGALGVPEPIVIELRQRLSAEAGLR
jgi:hypothetical protein